MAIITSIQHQQLRLLNRSLTLSLGTLPFALHSPPPMPPKARRSPLGTHTRVSTTRGPFSGAPRSPSPWSPSPRSSSPPHRPEAVLLGPRGPEFFSLFAQERASLDPGLETERGGSQVREPGRWVLDWTTWVGLSCWDASEARTASGFVLPCLFVSRYCTPPRGSGSREVRS